jgi:hypothetical protein
MKRPTRVVAAQCATKAIRPGNLDVGARQRPPILPKAVHIEGKLLQASAYTITTGSQASIGAALPAWTDSPFPTSWVGPFH